MPASSLATKLQIKPDMTVLPINPPFDYASLVEPLPAGARIIDAGAAPADMVQLFAVDRAMLTAELPAAVTALKPDGMLWISYPKPGMGIQTDLNRDIAWQLMVTQGWEGVRQVAMNDIWSAMRFKPAKSDNAEDPVDAHFSGQRETLRPIFDRIVDYVWTLGSDVEMNARETYIAFSRKQQFAVVKTRVRPLQLELGLRLPGEPDTDRLVAAGKSLGAESVTHKVVLTAVDQVDDQVEHWLAAAYHAARGPAES
ncbi:MAG: hypothetical protein IPK16_10930 [Anaerolineales bacterium]|nr:hypothetical protein [Anaerolineales bacterium]